MCGVVSPASLILAGKAYFGAVQAKKRSSFITLTPGVNVIILFSFIADDEAQHARGFAVGNPFQSGLRI
jgi:hypothetical protein